MPPVVTTVAIAIAGGGFAVPTAIQFAVAKFLVSTVASVAFNFVSGALTKKDSGGGGSFATIKSQGATQQFRQAVTDRRIVYGEARTSGPIVFPRVTDDNKYLHFVIVLASHEVEEIGEIIIDEESITDDMIDGSGVVNSGRYDGLVRIKKHLGSPTQTADADLVSAVPEWTTDHRLRQCAYVYVRYEWDRDKFPTGIPNLSAWVKGKKCYDPRDTVTRWTPNVALMTRDYLTDTRLGFKADTSFIDDTTTNSAANTCDEFVTTANIDIDFTDVDTANNIITLDQDRLQYQLGDRIQVQSGTIGGLSPATNYYVIPYQRKTTPRIKVASSLANAIAGTEISLTSGTSGTLRKNAEPRYFGGGVLKTSAERGENLSEIISGMAGQSVYSGGKWRILAGEYQTPTIYFNEDDVVGSIRVSTRVSKSDRFNEIQGVYISPLNDGNSADYPIVSNSTYATQDGGAIKRNLDLGFTQRPHTAQRIAKVALERMRQEIIFEASFKLTAMKVAVGDNFYFSFDRYGWSDKVFEVIDWTLASENNAPVIIIKARENASSVYDWNSGEETQVDPAPNTNLANPFDVDPPTGLAVTPIEIRTASGDLTYEFEIAWTPPSNFFVTNGGAYEVQFKRSTSSQWNTSYDAKGDDTTITVKQVSPGINYDVRIRSVNYIGVRSSYNNLFGFTVDSPSGATIALDYGLISKAVIDTIDYGLITESSADDQNDYGDIV
jgi:hypothetical protein